MRIKSIIVVVLTVTLGASCAEKTRRANESIPETEKARLDALAEIESSILLITCTGLYENYYYDPPENFAATIDQESLLCDKDYSTNSVAGTGLIIYKNSSKMVLLTCYHIVDFPDTLKTYYADENKKPSNYLQSLSVQYGLNVFVSHKSGRRSNAKIIATDEKNDIALIEAIPDANVLAELQFPGEFDRNTKVKLGEEVFLLGFPKGNFMVTRGLASPTSNVKKFVVDVPFNKGFSGGVVVAFTENYKNYYYLGMANTASVETESVLSPPNDPTLIERYREIPYEGDVYLRNLNLINYGISFIIKLQVIADFLDEEKETLDKMGYTFSHIIK